MAPLRDDAPVGVVIATRDRRASLLETLPRLLALRERPPVVVVDNGSADGTPAAIRKAFGDEVEVIEAGRNVGAGARTVGARRLATPYVAFSDDDSWWAPGALALACAVLDGAPSLALLAARVLVGPQERLDAVSEAMAESPLPAPSGVSGRGVVGFLACGAVVRRSAFLAVGGFDARYGIGGEEQRLALDLAAQGWRLAYVPAVIAHHHPVAGQRRPGRCAVQVRNDLWSAWLRRAPRPAARQTLRVLGRAASDHPAAALHGLGQALAGAPWVARERRPVPLEVERAMRAVEVTGR